MNSETFQISNGILELLINSDGSCLKIKGPAGVWECRDLVTFVYGGDIRLDAVRCGRVFMGNM